MGDKLKKIIVILLVSLCVFSIIPGTIIAHAADDSDKKDDRNTLRTELKKEEDTLRDNLDPINPFNKVKTKNIYDSAINIVKSQKNTGGNIKFSIGEKVKQLQRLAFELVIKSRSTVIITYAITLLVGILYASIMGSRDVLKRRKVILIIKRSTIIFFIYVNLPLFILWLMNVDKSQILNFSLISVFTGLIDFLQYNSVIISCLLAYAGISRLIISRRNLPIRKQGEYLIKFAFYSFIFINLIPMAIYFII